MSKLYLVPTPIGNLEDMTFRAVRVLKEVDFILAEDKRTSGKLLKHVEIANQMHSQHMHNEHKIVEGLAEQIMESENGFALITDAGTPAISDPGYLLVRKCIEMNIEVDCLPGATAFVPALVNSGLPCDTFYFEGFLPHKKGRQKKWLELSQLDKSIVFYESPYRVEKLLKEAQEHLGEDCHVSISREITKKFEETLRGAPSTLLQHFESKPPKGEFVVVVHK